MPTTSLQLVLDKKTAFEEAAEEKGMIIKGTGDDEFYFGMDAYRNSLPASENVPLLNYQLEADRSAVAIVAGQRSRPRW